MMTTKKIGTGEFEVLWNGNDTGRRIINGSRGVSGRDSRNMYGITTPGKPVTWIGSLQSCKGILEQTFKAKPPKV